MPDCLFCNIANKTIKSDIVYEDDKVLAFNDVAPQAPHHLLVIPRQHIATLNNLTEQEVPLMGHIIQVAKTLAKERDIAEKGYRIVVNCNADGGQAVYHLHLHLIAGRPLTWPPG